ncbi:MAG: translocation/assembly module TamB domain-containing protein [Candidatus Cloacimonadales bacterium]
MKKFMKWLKRILLVLLILVVIALSFTQSKLFRNLLRDQLVQQANLWLVDAELDLKKIEGNIFYSLQLHELTISNETTELISFEQLRIDYKLWPLLRKKIVLKQILLDALQLELKQDKAGAWNLLEILPTSDNAEKSAEATTAFAWKIDLQNFVLSKANISLNSQQLPPQIPRQINDFNLQLSAQYSAEESELDFQSCNFTTENPHLRLDNLQFEATLKDQVATVENFILQTAANKLQLAATYNLQKQLPTYLDLKTQSLDLNEFTAFLPQLPLQQFPKINLQAQLQDQSAEIALDFSQNQQKLQTTIQIDSLFATPQYQANLQLSQIDLQYWLDNPALNSQLNLSLDLQGTGITPETAQLQLFLDLKPSQIQNIKFASGQMQLEKVGSKLWLNSNLKSNLAHLAIEGQIADLFSAPNYQLTADLEHLDLAILIQNEELASDLNFSVDLQGKEFDPAQMEAQLKLSSQPSTIQGFPLDSLALVLDYQKGKYQLSDLALQTEFFDFSLQGSGQIEGNNQLQYKLVLADLSQLPDYLPIPALAADGSIHGNISGPIDSLQVLTQLALENIVFADLTLADLKGELLLQQLPTNWEAEAEVAFQTISYQDYQLDTLQIDLQGNEKELQSQIYAAADSLVFQLNNWISRDSLITIGIDKFNLSSGQLTLQNVDEQARFFIDQGRYQIKDFYLKSEDSSLSLNGVFAPNLEQDLLLEIAQFDLSLLNNFSPTAPEISGFLDFSANLGGSLANPSLLSSLQIGKFSIAKQKFTGMNLEAELADQLLQADFVLERTPQERVSGSAQIPLQIDKPRQLIDPDRELEIRLAIDELDLKFIAEFSDQIDKLQGVLQLDLAVTNSWRNPQLSGNLQLLQGSLNIPDYGLIYPEMNLKISFINRELRLDKFYLKGGEGDLQLQGWARMQKGLVAGIEEFEFEATAQNFSAASREGLELLTNLQLGFSGTPQRPRFSGNITVERARLDLDSLPQNKGPQVNVNEPLLVQALAKKQTPETETNKPAAQQIDLLKNLRGSLRLQIPRNTWIRNKDLNVEISGDLELVRKSNYYEIFGSLSTLRGSYNLYGRKFDLSDGRLIFNGGKEINPRLDLTISHIFRDMNKEKRELEIALSGNALQPNIMFYLDGEELNEADAISYLLFGKSSDQITQNQRSEIASQNESSLASVLLARQIGGQIAAGIGDRLNLDVVEFSGGDNWKEASILVGKYITNDIFLSYEKEFSLGNSKNYNPDKISLEYEINRYLSLRATSGSEKTTGIDLFWKYQKK